MNLSKEEIKEAEKIAAEINKSVANFYNYIKSNNDEADIKIFHLNMVVAENLTTEAKGIAASVLISVISGEMGIEKLDTDWSKNESF